jgi:hypothetical protein
MVARNCLHNWNLFDVSHGSAHQNAVREGVARRFLLLPNFKQCKYLLIWKTLQLGISYDRFTRANMMGKLATPEQVNWCMVIYLFMFWSWYHQRFYFLSSLFTISPSTSCIRHRLVLKLFSQIRNKSVVISRCLVRHYFGGSFFHANLLHFDA